MRTTVTGPALRTAATGPYPTATGPADVEVDSAVARAAIERDLSCYADQWRHLQGREVEAPYGPVDPEPDDIKELSRNGFCIRDASLHHGVDCIVAAWTGDSGRQLVEGAEVVSRCEHPDIDKLRISVGASRRRGRLELRPALLDIGMSSSTLPRSVLTIPATFAIPLCAQER